MAPTDALPAGWIALQDPTSGNTYYANQTTGEVTWDRPQVVAVPAPQPAYTSTPHSAHNEPEPSGQAAVQAYSNNGTTSTPNRLASKYGDGFVTSASHPELASQYGNVGTRYD